MELAANMDYRKLCASILIGGLVLQACSLPPSRLSTPSLPSLNQATRTPVIETTRQATKPPVATGVRPYSLTATAIAEEKDAQANFGRSQQSGTDTPSGGPPDKTSPSSTVDRGTEESRARSATPNSAGTQIVSDPPPTMSGNLLSNPYFEGCHNCTDINAWVNDGHWDISIKAHNPSINDTAARCTLPTVAGSCIGGGPANLFQVVQANASDRTLSFSISYIISRAKGVVTIYGGGTPNGPWTELWVPWTGTSGGAPKGWFDSGVQQIVLDSGYSYYKVNLFGQFDPNYNQGIKYTNAFFKVSP